MQSHSTQKFKFVEKVLALMPSKFIQVVCSSEQIWHNLTLHLELQLAIIFIVD